jgi:hypothetical protein
MLCGGNCVNVTTDPTHCGGCNTVCRSDQTCAAGACACRPGLTNLGGACVDEQTDPLHCGASNTACATGTTCVSGSCLAPTSCATPKTYCATLNLCLAFRSDPLHCGQDCQSLRACHTDEVCFNGRCEQFTVPAACNTCPCACQGSTCCSYPQTTQAICVDAMCP